MQELNDSSRYTAEKNMASKYDIAALIEALKSLYSTIASLDLQKRMGSYRRDNGAGVDHDIATPLINDIEKLAASSDGDNQRAPRHASSASSLTAAEEGSPNRQRIGHKTTTPPRRFTELSRFFGRKKTGSAFQPHMRDKLEASVWEHINTSLRLARKGDAKSAKLHADVANNALKEAARHMSEEEYSEFYGQVEKQLSEIGLASK
jgi:hypothetical protein